MSQTTRALKAIATGDDYQALANAIEQVDYDSMFTCYMRLLELLTEEKEKIKEGIENLPHRNKQEQRDKFQRAFDLAAERILPLWHRLDQQLSAGLLRTNAVDGEVFAFGKKGDPLAKTAGGMVVVLPGCKKEIGERVRFRVVQETEKLSFGRVIDLDAQSFYSLITQEVRDRIRDSLAVVDDYVKRGQATTTGDPLVELTELLRALQEVKNMSSTLRADESRRIAAQVLQYRRRLLFTAGVKLMFALISSREESDIHDFYRDGAEERTKALAALGLFRHYGYEAARQEFFQGEAPEGYTERLGEMSDKVDSMNAALEFMEFKSALDDALPRAKAYLDKMDRFFEKLVSRVKRVTDGLANEDLVDVEEFRSAIESAFSDDVLFAELRKSFRTSRDFLASRGAFMELNRRLGNQEALSAEAAFRPYLRHKITRAFGSDD